MKLKYVKSNGSRSQYIHNLCVAILEIYEKKQRFGPMRTAGLRDYIEKKTGEKKTPSAHGDSLGGHGLGIDVYRKSIKGKTWRVFDLTEDVLQKCRDWLDAEKDEDVLI